MDSDGIRIREWVSITKIRLGDERMNLGSNSSKRGNSISVVV